MRDTVDWSRLTHAYGTAEDVPEHIAALRSDDEDVRHEALGELFNSIVHQGTRYPASAYAVPPLLELMADPTVPDRAFIGQLLALIAIGGDEAWLPETLPVDELRLESIGGEEAMARVLNSGWEGLSVDDQAKVDALAEERAYDAVAAGLPLLRRLAAQPAAVAVVTERAEAAAATIGADAAAAAEAAAAAQAAGAGGGLPPAAAGPLGALPPAGASPLGALADDDGVALVSAYTIGWFPDVDPDASVAALDALAAVGDEPETAVAVVAAGLLGTAGSEPMAHRALHDPRPVVRWAGAVASAKLYGPAAGPQVAAELLHWAGGGSAPDVRMPYLDGDLAGYAALALRQLGPALDADAFNAFLARLPQTEASPALTIAGEALRLACPYGPITANTPFTKLDDRQQRLAQVLAASPRTWLYDEHRFANFSMLLGEYGFPDELEAMRRFITP
ncbi:hypothetical protein [Cryptosporangium phraense]|uniref:HEAT repeat domain-containing protein n=1 Tax=Cryptosporangium phraense TaxID=2593070 RepID=A0A545AYH2_9ACTN|nr:hypothetical protein [Cryptosporangium phraense]TQS46380.1 hypothetical protein FL583_03020 [Cryptosporangium phraense]